MKHVSKSSYNVWQRSMGTLARRIRWSTRLCVLACLDCVLYCSKSVVRWWPVMNVDYLLQQSQVEYGIVLLYIERDVGWLMAQQQDVEEEEEEDGVAA
jgi:hypothetical protein